MLLALISDIHSNLPALRATLEKIDELGAEKIICCGDIVGYNSFPSECFYELSKRGIESVMGNHDYAALTGDTKGFNKYAAEAIEWTRKNFDTKKLSSLPIRIEKDDILFTHGSPRSIFEYIFPDSSRDLLESIADKERAFTVLGHTHVPMMVETKKGIYINPGSVGQPRDGDPRGSFALLDSERKKVSFQRLEYDIDETVRANRKAGLPGFLSDRLYLGV
ncbi:MAG: metallophosphoesterase family protein [Candidatus Thermoplasmatota archaeon]|nr:metallophosphoesterase family protein [Candidatus Thermoplasmatota archaeon]